MTDLAMRNASYIVFCILSEKLLHGKYLVGIICPTHLFLLRCFEHFVGNNGFMRIGVEIPIHEAIVFDFGTTCADGLLEQHPASVLFIGNQLVDCFTIPLGLPIGEGMP